MKPAMVLSTDDGGASRRQRMHQLKEHLKALQLKQSRTGPCLVVNLKLSEGP